MLDLLLSQLIEGFVLARQADGYSPHTIEQYKWGLKLLLENTGDVPISQVTKTEIRMFLSGLQKTKLSGTSIFHVWKSIRALYKWASVEFEIKRPDLDIHAPPHEYEAVIPFTQDELKLLIKSVEFTAPDSSGKFKGRSAERAFASRDKAILLLLLDTGIRAGELERLKKSEVDLISGVIQIHPFMSGKKSRPRTIPIGTSTRKALWKYFAEREQKDGPAFIGKFGEAVTAHGLIQLLRRMGARAKVSGVHPHRFRHTFAITYLRNGGDIFTLQRMLGHASLDMVRHYLNLAMTDDTNAHRKASPVDNWKL